MSRIGKKPVAIPAGVEVRLDGDALTGRGPYRAVIKLNAQMIPVNLIAAVERVGFDYNMSARELADAVVAGSETLWEKEIVFEVDG